MLDRLANRFGIQGVAHRWLTSYFAGQEQFVSIGNEWPTSRTVGFHRALVLGLLLYSLYMAPLGVIIVSPINNMLITHIYSMFNTSVEGDLEHDQSRLESCAHDIDVRIPHNKLKLNDD